MTCVFLRILLLFGQRHPASRLYRRGGAGDEHGLRQCFADQSTCVTNSCFLTWLWERSGLRSLRGGRLPTGFETCAGIVDLDGDGESTVCDCDDDNAAVFPGAPGTAQGVDSNCDGVCPPRNSPVYST